MSTGEIHFSDLSGKPILDQGELVKVRVIEHPVLNGKPVVFEATSGELKGLDKVALTVAVLEIELPGEQSMRVIVDVAAFDKLATNQPMADLLKGAKGVPAQRPVTTTNRAERVDYTDVRYAGRVKRGIISEGEKVTIRAHFDEVNANLRAAGQRELDLTDAAIVDRYELHDLARERSVVPIVDMEEPPPAVFAPPNYDQYDAAVSEVAS